MTEDSSTFKHTPEFKAQFDMGQLDYQRYNMWLEQAEKCSAEINSCAVPTLQQVQNYFAALNVLYKCWKTLIFSTIQTGLDKKIKSAKTDKRMWENNIASGMPMNKVIILRLIDTLDDLHTDLMDIKQKIGLGIRVKRTMSTAEKIKTGIHGNSDFENLPDAD
jgi:hypothetical protein